MIGSRSGLGWRFRLDDPANDCDDDEVVVPRLPVINMLGPVCTVINMLGQIIALIGGRSPVFITSSHTHSVARANSRW